MVECKISLTVVMVSSPKGSVFSQTVWHTTAFSLWEAAAIVFPNPLNEMEMKRKQKKDMINFLPDIEYKCTCLF